MDGTLVDSAAGMSGSRLVNCADSIRHLVGVVGAWELFKQKYPEIDVEDVLSCESDALNHEYAYKIQIRCARNAYRG